jgi:predicted RNase H-like nuclease
VSARVAGVDGCPGGWLAVILGGDGPARATATILPDLPALLALEASVIALDMPIGLVDSPGDARPADRAARRFLSERNATGVRAPGSRVFASPARAHLDVIRAGGGYREILASFPRGQRLSKQCFNNCDRIIALDDLGAATHESRIWEVHPEVSFTALAGRTPAPKKSPEGRRTREAALSGLGFDLPALAVSLGARTRRWNPDDLLDACAAAWSAGRIADGRHATLPHPPERDRRGHRMAIHY